MSRVVEKRILTWLVALETSRLETGASSLGNADPGEEAGRQETLFPGSWDDLHAYDASCT